ncbi:MAG: STAS domain-containing protein [Magnetococcales bacterium]|nr:STAS domain-containing protein [Magnetococcales bacterium]
MYSTASNTNNTQYKQNSSILSECDHGDDNGSTDTGHIQKQCGETIEIIEQNGKIVIILPEFFNYRFRHSFLNDVAGRLKSKEIYVDFSNVEFIDSTGLGMLLLLREWCDKQKILLTIAHPNNKILNIFEKVEFDKMFNIFIEP